MEQYQRRLCLRINGIQCSADETAEDCLEKVKSLFKAELNMEIPELAIDRAHRIGRVSHAENGKKYQSIIVRFTTWRFRTQVFKARKKTTKFKIHLDLTRKRIKLLAKANGILHDHEDFFAMADINCRLCIKLEENRFHYFRSETELIELLKYV